MSPGASKPPGTHPRSTAARPNRCPVEGLRADTLATPHPRACQPLRNVATLCCGRQLAQTTAQRPAPRRSASFTALAEAEAARNRRRSHACLSRPLSSHRRPGAEGEERVECCRDDEGPGRVPRDILHLPLECPRERLWPRRLPLHTPGTTSAPRWRGQRRSSLTPPAPAARAIPYPCHMHVAQTHATSSELRSWRKHSHSDQTELRHAGALRPLPL